MRNKNRYIGELAPVSAARRYLNQNPYIDTYVSKRAVYYKEKYDVAQAHDAITIATTASVKASVERYLQPRVIGSLSDERANLIVKAMWPLIFLTSSMLYSPGVPHRPETW